MTKASMSSTIKSPTLSQLMTCQGHWSILCHALRWKINKSLTFRLQCRQTVYIGYTTFLYRH